MVAKSYESYEKVGEPYSLNGRQYIKVQVPNGSIKQVRWYSEKEYHKMYPDSSPVESFNQKRALGFTNGYITIFKGNTYEDRDWFKTSSARYSRFWGWYFVSEEKIPEDIPEDVTPIQLPWDKVSIDNKLMPEEQLKKVIETLIYDPSPSEYVGEEGDRMALQLFIDRVVPVDGAYGVSNIHTMHDAANNIFVWATTAKSLTPGKWYSMTGTVKAHKVYQNAKQTWLTRCLSVKEVS